jgi:hypothetical protein
MLFRSPLSASATSPVLHCNAHTIRILSAWAPMSAYSLWVLSEPWQQLSAHAFMYSGRMRTRLAYSCGPPAAADLSPLSPPRRSGRRFLLFFVAIRLFHAPTAPGDHTVSKGHADENSASDRHDEPKRRTYVHGFLTLLSRGRSSAHVTSRVFSWNSATRPAANRVRSSAVHSSTF